MEVVKDVTSESLIKLAIIKVKRGSIIYSDRYWSYDGLVSIGFSHERIDYSKRCTNGKVYIYGIVGVWSYAKERLIMRLTGSFCSLLTYTSPSTTAITISCLLYTSPSPRDCS